MTQFKVGETVKLKSGGPMMTISSEGAPGYFVCAWFEGSEVKSATFQDVMLRSVDVHGVNVPIRHG